MKCIICINYLNYYYMFLTYNNKKKSKLFNYLFSFITLIDVAPDYIYIYICKKAYTYFIL